MSEREHYTSIALDEDSHQAAMCGCALERDEQGTVRFYQCGVHDAALSLLAALNEARTIMNMPINMQQARRGQRAAMIEHIDAILAKVRA